MLSIGQLAIDIWSAKEGSRHMKNADGNLLTAYWTREIGVCRHSLRRINSQHYSRGTYWLNPSFAKESQYSLANPSAAAAGHVMSIPLVARSSWWWLLNSNRFKWYLHLLPYNHHAIFWCTAYNAYMQQFFDKEIEGRVEMLVKKVFCLQIYKISVFGTNDRSDFNILR